MSDEPIRIGELLVEAGVIGKEKLHQRLAVARQLGLPLGQILVQSRDLGKEQFLAALQVQSLLLECLITVEQAARAVAFICLEGQELNVALSKVGFLETQTLAYRLGDLLLAAEVISEDDLTFALLTSGEIAIPLGHALIQTGVVVPDVVAAALTAQKQIRNKSVSPEEAIASLRSAGLAERIP